MSTLNVSNITDGTTTVGTSYVVNGSAKAWVNFNGQGTIALRDSYNVSSLTDNGTGTYTVSYTSSFANANYTHSGMSGLGNTSLNNISQNFTTYPPSTGSAVYQTTYANGNLWDASFVGAAVMGDLA